MPWTYHQRTGIISGAVSGVGYSGKGDGKNNPDMQQVRGVGPLPVGRYRIGLPFDHPEKGPVCMRLVPDHGNQMFGRSEFMIHGDSIAHPGEASDGCIIQSRPVREAVGRSTDRWLNVVAE